MSGCLDVVKEVERRLSGDLVVEKVHLLRNCVRILRNQLADALVTWRASYLLCDGFARRLDFYDPVHLSAAPSIVRLRDWFQSEIEAIHASDEKLVRIIADTEVKIIYLHTKSMSTIVGGSRISRITKMLPPLPKIHYC